MHLGNFIVLQLPILPEIFQIATVNRLMNMVGTLAARNVDTSFSGEEKKRWQDWELITKALALDEEKLLVCLGAQAKALLFWMHGGLDGRPSIQFQVNNSRASLLRVQEPGQIAPWNNGGLDLFAQQLASFKVKHLDPAMWQALS